MKGPQATGKSSKLRIIKRAADKAIKLNPSSDLA